MGVCFIRNLKSSRGSNWKTDAKNKTKDWFDDECLHVTSGKNEAHKCMIQRNSMKDTKNSTRASVEKYKNARRYEKRFHKKKQRQQENEKIEKLEELGNENQARKFYK